jgi:hypothetical protein
MFCTTEWSKFTGACPCASLLTSLCCVFDSDVLSSPVGIRGGARQLCFQLPVSAVEVFGQRNLLRSGYWRFAALHLKLPIHIYIYTVMASSCSLDISPPYTAALKQSSDQLNHSVVFSSTSSPPSLHLKGRGSLKHHHGQRFPHQDRLCVVLLLLQ